MPQHHLAKHWEIIDLKTATIHETTNIKAFCADNQIAYESINHYVNKPEILKRQWVFTNRPDANPLSLNERITPERKLTLTKRTLQRIYRLPYIDYDFLKLTAIYYKKEMMWQGVIKNKNRLQTGK